MALSFGGIRHIQSTLHGIYVTCKQLASCIKWRTSLFVFLREYGNSTTSILDFSTTVNQTLRANGRKMVTTHIVKHLLISQQHILKSKKKKPKSISMVTVFDTGISVNQSVLIYSWNEGFKQCLFSTAALCCIKSVCLSSLNPNSHWKAARYI